jgi:arylsulfatase A-like enzyme
VTDLNILWIVLDAARASNCSCYGHNRQTTPAIDTLSNDGILFERAVSPTVGTLDSVASMLSGTYPSEHQSGRFGQVNINGSLLTERLSDYGYTTGMITCNPFLTPSFGFEADRFSAITNPYPSGMDMRKFFSENKHLARYQRYLRFLQSAADLNLPSHLANALQFKFGLFDTDDDGAQRATNNTSEFISDVESPWFLYVHYTETHMNSTGDLPYSVPTRDRYRFVNDSETLPELQTQGGEVSYSDEQRDTHERLYDGALRYLDRHVEKLINKVDLDKTIVIITSDHGELLGEHNLLGHCQLYEPGVRVPLVIYHPRHDRERVTERINIIDLYQTIIEEVGIQDSNETGNLLTDERKENILVQDYTGNWEWSRYSENDGGKHALYHDEYKYIRSGNSTELYDLNSDPNETADISANRTELIDKLNECLNKKLNKLEEPSGNNQTIEFDNNTRKQLKRLGYLE